MKSTQLCCMCGKQKRNVSLQPSRTQLLFGGFYVRMEYRCRYCEREVARWATKLIKNL